MANEIGKVRRSAVLANFAPGAVADFRAGRAAISGVVAGLEEWDRSAPPAGLLNKQVVHEARLEKKLGVKGFRLPLVIDEDYKDKDGEGDKRRLVAARLPRWLQCPECSRIASATHWSSEPGKAEKYCASCSGAAPVADRIYCVPVRFVMACDNGHLDDFPWHFWVAHKEGCDERKFLDLKSRGAGLSGLVVSCRKCKAERTMEGVFSVETWKNFKCSGRRPWLAAPDQDCGQRPRAVQRGASNLYFSVISSALSIPPWSDELQDELGVYWDPIVKAAPHQRAQFITTLSTVLGDFLAQRGMTPEQLAAEIGRRLELLERPETLDIRGEEYQQLTFGAGDPKNRSREFECRPEKVPDVLKPYFDRFVRVVRLREVRALRGFTRINPPGDENAPGIARLSAQPMDWLPGIEVRGEGVFVEFAAVRLADWERDPKVEERAARVHGAWRDEWRSRHDDQEPPYPITPRYLLVHTFAHVLMRQLTLECGYSSAALRERLYIRGGDTPMAGVLIYTSTSDADGTLGGLQRQGEARRLEVTVPAALKAIEWCSSDPLCITDMMGGTDFLTLAACHACSMAPETSCEEFNRFLDRGMLLGVPAARGYFQPLMEE